MVDAGAATLMRHWFSGAESAHQCPEVEYLVNVDKIVGLACRKTCCICICSICCMEHDVLTTGIMQTLQVSQSGVQLASSIANVCSV